MGDCASHDENGLQKVYPSPKPFGTVTYYSGSGDDLTLGIGKGQRISAKVLATDTEKTIDLLFNEDIYIKGGLIQCVNAPFGATFDFHIYHKTYMVEVATYARCVPLYGTQVIYLSSDDRALLTQDLFVRCSIHNSDNNTYPEHDPASEFRFSGSIEMYRTTTYNG